MKKRLFLIFVTLLGSVILLGQANRLDFGDLNFNLNVHASKRISDNNYQNMSFNTSRESWADSIRIVFSNADLDLNVTISPRSQYLRQAWYFDVRAEFKQNTFVRELMLGMDNRRKPIHAELTGVEAIQNRTYARNRAIGPFMDQAVEFSCGDQSFWIVASGYDGCDGVEGIAMNRIVLYTFQAHFFRMFDPVIQRCSIYRDTMYKAAGESERWGFLLFTEEPVLLDLNRWLANNKAALCITNDADGEALPRLQAVFEGSNNPSNPSYYTKGFFAWDIPVSTTIHGVNEPALGEIWRLIKSKGNRIGWHTYTMLADPPGSNEQALLHDLVDLEIRHWIDHSVPNNPEDVAYDGLDPDSPYYVADVINQSDIVYIWPGDTPNTNPFNAYDEAWRLPHKVWEATVFTKPVWFYGRTRAETWEYLDQNVTLSMKHIMVPENLDVLIAERGLHINYTHFCMSQIEGVRKSFWELLPNGDYVVRDDVDEMLQLLDYYRQYRGLWIAPLEDIFDRMLDVEEVKILAVEKMDEDGILKVTLANNAERDIDEFYIQSHDKEFMLSRFPSGSSLDIILTETTNHNDVPGAQMQIRYQQGALHITKASGEQIDPVRVELFNLKGQKLMEQDSAYQQWEIVIPFAGKASGIYLARFSRPGRLPIVQKFSVIK
ncbi:MAG: hypothetical protein GXY81_04040 [Candidatus Cloacimonetes bacterium]|nr:hypothetical protein [Candidatus Cloacimonadota bacterium]